MRNVELAAIAAYALGTVTGTVLADTLAQAAVGALLTVIVAIATVRAAERTGVVDAP